MSPRFATYFHVHLVSDSTGETLNAMAKAVCARFDAVLPIEHIYALVRSRRQLERVLREVEGAPGMVLHTIVDKDLRAALEEGCRELDMPCVAALDPLVASLARYLGASITTRVGAQHALDHEYFNRIAALDYAMAHDDGQGAGGVRRGRRDPGGRQPHLEDADLHLPGAPRGAGGERAAGAPARSRRLACSRCRSR
jgi:regulator of PEP synthase PpsR (kinase-PPPase family)